MKMNVFSEGGGEVYFTLQEFFMKEFFVCEGFHGGVADFLACLKSNQKLSNFV